MIAPTRPTVDDAATFAELVLSDLLRYRPDLEPTWRAYLLRAPFHPGLLVSPLLRANERLWVRGHQRLAGLVRTLTSITFGMDMVPGTRFGRRLYLPHPSGIVIGFTTLGEDVTLLQNTTIGAAKHADGRIAHRGTWIGDRVSISAGVVIMDDVRIGCDVEFGANSVILRDVADGSVMVGIPARDIRKTSGPTEQAG